MGARRIIVAVLALALAGCASFPRAPAPIGRPAAAPDGFAQVRVSASDPRLIDILQRNLARMRRPADKPLSVLALSGGGAEGAFGAGVLAGWTKTGARPEFQVVTGVSTGALIAPFAYLGPEWDDKLRDAFAGQEASGLLATRGLGVLVRRSTADARSRSSWTASSMRTCSRRWRARTPRATSCWWPPPISTGRRR